jgi:hypothetical protein
LEALKESPKEFAHAYDALNRLAARVLSHDPAGMSAELEKSLAAEKPRVNIMGGNA